MKFKITTKLLTAASFLVSLSLYSGPTITLKNISEQGLKIYNEKMTAYPAMEVPKFEKEAEEKYPLYKEGDEITLNTIRSVVKGKFYSYNTKYITIGSTNVPVVDVDSTTLAKFSKEENQKLRNVHIKMGKDAYNIKKLEFREKLLEEIYSQYPALNAVETARLFKNIASKDANTKYSEAFRNFYDSSLPVKGTRDDFMKQLTDDFAKKYPELALDDDIFILKTEKEANEKRDLELKAKRLARLKERILNPKAATPVFEPDGGVFEPTKPLKISCSTQDAEIRYTFDGTEPNEDSPLYTEPVALPHPLVVKAKTFHKEFNDSDIAETGAWAGGLYASYFETMTFRGKTFEKVDPCVNFNWGNAVPTSDLPGDLISMIWTGQITPKTSETYTIHLTCDDGARLWIGEKLIIDAWKEQPPTDYEATILFEAGRKYDIKLALTEVQGQITAKLQWSSPKIKLEVIPQDCLMPEGKYVNEMKTWNKLEKNEYVNRARTKNPGSYLDNFRLTIRGGQERWNKLGIK
ncbi:MAG TPA: hypothetical protein DCZ94_18025 [Lentisphaeria bacterium]|nr:MAG: hypothetical protein A2X48_20600 [Lentisphaerae bacterium GWF2_49_21]HBC88845.1 hypothetical protein [Lentisphaeria bacterium]